ncbi:MAG: hypothetical protein VSS75_033855 [Candidatus Parabeggiatoa sp.]|nr:hypothetical protein [Candidatus Parabeggiatoa sp.]
MALCELCVEKKLYFKSNSYTRYALNSGLSRLYQRQIRALESALRNLEGPHGQITQAKEQRARERCRDLEQQARFAEN